MKLHTTRNPCLVLRKTGPADQDGHSFKPVGFWYSVGNAWIDWCRSNMDHWIHPYTYALAIESDNVLRLNTPGSVDAFTKEYATPWVDGIMHGIDWARLSDTYDGIEFNPYFYNQRFDMNRLWYNGIDVPSGVIFNTDIIKELTRHDTAEFVKEMQDLGEGL